MPIKNVWFHAIALTVLAFAVFGSVILHNGFVFDDEDEILNNPIIQTTHHWDEIFKGSTFGNAGQTHLDGIYYRPLMMLSFSILWNVFGSDPAPFHGFQFFLHLFNTLLFLFLARKFVQPLWAFLMAALFLVHPLNVEAIVYASSLQDPLFTFFGLIAFYLVATSEILSWQKTAFVSLFFLFALLSKETALFLVVATAVFSFIQNRQSFLKVTVASLVAFGAYLCLRLGVAHLHTFREGTTQIGRADFFTRLLTAPLALWTYVWQTFYPHPLLVTEDWVVTQPSLLQLWLPLLGLTLFVVGICFLAYKLRTPWAWSCLTLILATFTLNSHLVVPMDGTVSNRWYYLISLGLIGLLGEAISRWRLSERRQILVQSFAVASLIVFSILSFFRSQNWTDGYTLYSHDIIYDPGSFYLQNNLGVELFRRGEIQAAQAHFEKSVELAPHWTINWNNLGATYQRMGRNQDAIRSYEQSIKNGTYYLAYLNYAELLLLEKRPHEALEFLNKKALPRFPASTHLHEYAKALSQK